MRSASTCSTTWALPRFSPPAAITITSRSTPGRAGGQPPQGGSTGLYHFAINYPTRKDLAVAFKRLLDNGWQIDGYNDHGTHIALYLHDPDFNGIELAWDRDPSEWPQFQNLSNDEAVANMMNGHRRLDLRALLAEATADTRDEVMTPA